MSTGASQAASSSCPSVSNVSTIRKNSTRKPVPRVQVAKLNHWFPPKFKPGPRWQFSEVEETQSEADDDASKIVGDGTVDVGPKDKSDEADIPRQGSFDPLELHRELFEDDGDECANDRRENVVQERQRDPVEEYHRLGDFSDSDADLWPNDSDHRVSRNACLRLLKDPSIRYSLGEHPHYTQWLHDFVNEKDEMKLDAMLEDNQDFAHFCDKILRTADDDMISEC